jgi:hypothetical protein
MSDELEDLFGDDEEEQQQEHEGNILQDEDAAAAQQADEEVDYGAGLEDEMDEAADAAGGGEGGLGADEERELFGGLEDDEDDAAAGPQEERGPPIDVHAPLLPRYAVVLFAMMHWSACVQHVFCGVCRAVAWQQ